MRKPSWDTEVATVTQLRKVKGPGLKPDRLSGRIRYDCGFPKVKNCLLYNVHLRKRKGSKGCCRQACVSWCFLQKACKLLV